MGAGSKHVGENLMNKIHHKIEVHFVSYLLKQSIKKPNS